jgi:triacylglycerol lipase
MAIPTPIILHHGFMDVLNLRVGKRGVYSFVGLERMLGEAGRPAVLTRVHPTASVQRRAEQLKIKVLEILANYRSGTRVLVVAHSMGGLDTRYMISRLGMEKKVAALLTIATPHRGTAYADYALRNMNRLRVTPLLKMLALDVEGVSDLTIEACARFNEQTPNHPAVRYFSVSSACETSALPPWSRRAHRIIAEIEGPNDGLVSVRSATYAEHLGTWPVSHWALLAKSIRPRRHMAITQRYGQCIDHVLEQIE